MTHKMYEDFMVKDAEIEVVSYIMMILLGEGGGVCAICKRPILMKNVVMVEFYVIALYQTPKTVFLKK